MFIKLEIALRSKFDLIFNGEWKSNLNKFLRNMNDLKIKALKA
jgi:hypothetical protein